MAYISFQPSDFFSTLLYTGTGGASGSTQTITGVGFQSDFTWIKGREGFDHVQQDSVRGATYQVNSNNNYIETNRTDELTAWTSDGFALGIDTVEGVVNNSGNTYASWNWKAGTTTGLSGGTITPTAYSINTTSGFSTIAYTGNASAGATVPHGLGVVPEMMIVKCLNSTTDWNVYHKDTHSTPEDYILVLNTTAVRADNGTSWNDTAPTSTVFTLGGGGDTNVNTNTYIAYCFAGKKGYSKFGEYVGNGNADGPVVYTGFRPAWVMIKRTDSTGDWYLYDDKRLGYNIDNNEFYANTTNAEQTNDRIDLLSNGFKLRNDGSGVNASSGEYIYMAFAEFPIVSSNDIPTVAR